MYRDLSVIMVRMRVLIFIVFVSFLLAGCTTQFRINAPLERHDPDYGYRLKDIAAPDRSEELLLILTFSGGGTRAAALSYGVLSELAKTRIAIQRRERRLIDEVDMISSVVGRGVDPVRIAAVGYGEAYPVAGNATASERQLNRRVDILLKTKAK